MENADNVDAHPDKVGGGDDSIDAKFSGYVYQKTGLGYNNACGQV